MAQGGTGPFHPHWASLLDYNIFFMSSNVQKRLHTTVVKRHMVSLLARLMGRSAEYRKRAAEFRAKAQTAFTRESAKEFYGLAESYTRLADQADRNDGTDLVYEPPPPKLNG
jgi:hypothetical protein